jgi:hypothetical protein
MGEVAREEFPPVIEFLEINSPSRAMPLNSWKITPELEKLPLKFQNSSLRRSLNFWRQILSRAMPVNSAKNHP